MVEMTKDEVGEAAPENKPVMKRVVLNIETHAGDFVIVKDTPNIEWLAAEIVSQGLVFRRKEADGQEAWIGLPPSGIRYIKITEVTHVPEIVDGVKN